MFWLHCSSSNFYLFYTQFVSYYPVLILIMLLNDDILDAYIWLKILYSRLHHYFHYHYELLGAGISNADYLWKEILRPKGQTTFMAFSHFIYFSFILSICVGSNFLPESLYGFDKLHLSYDV